MVAIVASITSAAAGISATASVADGYGIIGARNKASQEHKAQHCSSAHQCREGCDHHPAASHTTQHEELLAANTACALKMNADRLDMTITTGAQT